METRVFIWRTQDIRLRITPLQKTPCETTKYQEFVPPSSLTLPPNFSSSNMPFSFQPNWYRPLGKFLWNTIVKDLSSDRSKGTISRLIYQKPPMAGPWQFLSGLFHWLKEQVQTNRSWALLQLPSKWDSFILLLLSRWRTFKIP